MAISEIYVFKARVHNLKEVSVKIPKNSLTVVTGPSGSGKSSLAFDTIYVEGQRRYIESLSSYARQFLGQHQPPDVESITGLSPSIAIDQKTSSKNPRSTVGTVTEIFDYLRVLFARVGTLYCPESGEVVRSYTPGQITKAVLESPKKSKVHIMAPISFKTKSELDKLMAKYQSMGFTRCFLNGEICQMEELKLPKKIESFCVVVDRLVLKEGAEKRLTDSVEFALKLAMGDVHILIEDELKTFSQHNKSPTTGETYPDLEPRLFSFNSPIGACPHCNGLGQMKTFDADLMVFDDSLPLAHGALGPLSKKNSFLYKMVMNIAEHEKVDAEKKAYKDLPQKFKKVLFEGNSKKYKFSFQSENSKFEFSKEFPGIPAWLEKKYFETGSEKVRKDLEEYMRINTCPHCEGYRLNPVALSTLIDGKHIMQLCELSIGKLAQFFEKLKFNGEKKIIAEKLLKEITSRLMFLNNVGLDYLNLSRSAATLSGGEAQRIRLATQIGAALSGVLYVLDEPSIGLHQRDNQKLIQTLISLRDIGNTVIVVEHDEDTMRAADFIVDMGPGAGIHGGEVVAKGPLQDVLKVKKSLTTKYLTGESQISWSPREINFKKSLKLKGAKANNLKSVDCEIPLNCLTLVTGVSGSGKSSLIHEVLVPAMKSQLHKAHRKLYSRNNYHSLVGVDQIKTLIELDQSPIGRTPHSNPATYTGLFDEIRKLFASTNESQIRGYKPGRFSFNVKGGRCEECEGNGVKKIEMHFLPDVYVTCSECHGSRYNNETLSVLYKGKNISDVLEMTLEEALDFFGNHRKMKRILKTMNDVGLGYIKLGQPATTLSGGEAQRLKLARELAKSTKGHCFYVLDEPTTGLHFQDIQVLLEAVQSLVDQGHSVLIIEHNLDVIKSADYVIDLGPDGGDKGGEILAQCPPKDLVKIKKSHTGQFLKPYLK